MRHMSHYKYPVIRSFRHRGLKRLFEDGDRSRLRPDHVAKLERILARLDESDEVGKMGLPGFRLHTLSGATLRGSGPSRFRPTGGSFFVLRTVTPTMSIWSTTTRRTQECR